MSDTSQGPGWWLASDGKWYPPADTDAAPGPGWWLASDGKWYPPADTDAAPGPGWWLASDGTWYPPADDATSAAAASPAATGAAPAKPKAVKPTPVKPKAVKPKAVKPKAVTPAAAKPVPAKPVPATPATDAKPAAAKPVPAKPVPAKPVPAKPAAEAKPKPAAAKPVPATDAKPAAAKPAAEAKPAAKAAEPKPPADEPPAAPRRPAAGLTSQTQIYVQNQASRADAQVLAQARSAAALRALQSLGADVATDDEPALRTTRAARDLDLPASAPAAAKPAAAAPAPAPSTKAPTPAPSAPTPAPSAASARTEAPIAEPDATEPAAASGPPPLLEVKPSPLNTDVSHVGDRLVIFNDRVEMHDRNDRVRQVIRGEDITDVVVHRKFTGASVTVESISGEVMVAKGLRPDQAEEVRSVIQRRTRQGRPDGEAAARPSTTAAPAPEAQRLSSTVRPATLDKDDLLAKLDDLHAAGILTDRELAAKRALVQRLATPLASSPR